MSRHRGRGSPLQTSRGTEEQLGGKTGSDTGRLTRVAPADARTGSLPHRLGERFFVYEFGSRRPQSSLTTPGRRPWGGGTLTPCGGSHAAGAAAFSTEVTDTQLLPPSLFCLPPRPAPTLPAPAVPTLYVALASCLLGVQPPASLCSGSGLGCGLGSTHEEPREKGGKTGLGQVLTPQLRRAEVTAPHPAFSSPSVPRGHLPSAPRAQGVTAPRHTLMVCLQPVHHRVKDYLEPWLA
ncbi:hypothetical protein HJG60_010401 [Phyllostomus discolor]|uniref:Uncharacterized protein n=1 Tax=Phyllostomus discolor TaxID=89673 RepID=A0A834AX10_9CHIR|nr:hypothetical protein HJG60_010401 [Phyllostomus discolor]